MSERAQRRWDVLGAFERLVQPTAQLSGGPPPATLFWRPPMLRCIIGTWTPG